MKTLMMPNPTDDQDNKDVHEVKTGVFNPSGGRPSYQQVQQAPAIANCPVAALLAAMAFTPVGSATIQGMISAPTTGTVRTDLSKLPANTLTNPPSTTYLDSQRFFTVKLASGAVETSDVLYTNDGDRDSWSVLYLRDPNGQSIWASIIEKALAQSLGSYQQFNETKLQTNDFWRIITGVRPGVLLIDDRTAESDIISAANDSVRKPSIAASKDDLPIVSGSKADVDNVSSFHGHAMIGVQGVRNSKIKLYDPAKAKELQLTPAEFKRTMKAIVFQK
jgi:hypothetical protein